MKYIIFQTPFGVAAAVISPKGLRRVFIGCNSPEALRKRIAIQFPRATPGVGRALVKIAFALNSYFKGQGLKAVFAMDLRWATSFQKKTYYILRKTKPGMVICYSELARRAGRPGAARAIGTAMSKNQIPIFIPCHRVIKQNGQIGGFSAPGGANLKKKLLRLESTDIIK
ncbi:MAG: methylated-DNA--[protein]-cysteine S-methyltransferase [Planctomycetes bacterium]|nr:methylated-DNA--[protein]-cysteine S-methyltransferase [Planctomycetota bacterium]